MIFALSSLVTLSFWYEDSNGLLKALDLNEIPIGAIDGKFILSLSDLVSLDLDSCEVNCCLHNIKLLLRCSEKGDGGITPLGSPA